ncbi:MULTISPECIES: bifunctional alpha/beta hydrolase/OsmC family protein [unclassified Thioalkalivibrio]|uniref:bifunctional alpha/beta hydrolase/OsmC family protein n=1 Tax=unclassified Thioalkalivibrio TaxID=2621013 RepID=UPI00035D0C37|nr:MULTISPECIES: alpha/beta fold hydrolase [unclassified Thioalkalivibrio]
MRRERVEFPGHRGQMLAGRIDRPTGPVRAWALFAHCFTCGKDNRAANRIARGLAETGIATLRFDFTGLGDSEGDFANSGFSSNLEDLLAAADYLRGRDAAPALLVGHSLGGAAVLGVAGRIPECRAVATIAAPFEADSVLDHFGEALETIETEGEATVNLAGRPFRIRREFVEDLRSQTQAERIRDLDRPLMILHAPGDTVVSVDAARRIFETARHPKSFVSLDDADHTLLNPADAEYVAGLVAAWGTRYIGEERGDSADADAPGDGTAVTVEETGDGQYQQDVRIGPHHFLADEPPDVGGDGTGPNPYELLLASLGACTSMTLRMYAAHKQLPLERVRVHLQHEKLKGENGPVDRITREITIEGDLDAKQRERMLQIADRCPVHRTLHGEVQVETRERSTGTSDAR